MDSGFVVEHEESQQDGSKDVIEIKYNTKDHQYGVYAKEYRSAHVPKKGHKAADQKQKDEYHLQLNVQCS